MNDQSQSRLPNPENFFVDIPIYQPFEISAASAEQVYAIEYFKGSIDAYCRSCKKDSIFERQNPSFPNYPQMGSGGAYMQQCHSIEDVIGKYGREAVLNKRVFGIVLECKRNFQHKIYFIFGVFDNRIIKIGQYPSIADFRLPDLDKYKKILDDKGRKELARAIGLCAHGVGVGSFVYLRRIFEGLVEKAHIQAIDQKDWDEEKYIKSRMDEKIELLKAYLPKLLVENAKVYSILSKGLHELADDECLEYFETVRIGIQLILDEELEKHKKEKERNILKKEIDRIQGSLR